MANSCTLKLDIDVVFQLVNNATKSAPGTGYGILLGSRPSVTEMRASEFLSVSRLGDHMAPLCSTLRAFCGDCDPVAYFVTVPGHIYLRDESFQNTCCNCLKNLTDGNQGIDFVFLLTLDPFMLEFGVLDFKAFTLGTDDERFCEAPVMVSPGVCEMTQLLTLLKDTPGLEFLVKPPLPNINTLIETMKIYKNMEHNCIDNKIRKIIHEKLTMLNKLADTARMFLGL